MGKSRDLNIDKNFIETIRSLRKPSLEPETGWWKIGPAGGSAEQARDVQFENSWAHSDEDAWPVKWHQSHHGEVRIKGKVIGDVEGTTIFTLPEEDRPQHEQEFVVSVDDDGNIDLSSIRFRAFSAGDLE